MAAPDMEVIKDIPGYKVILKAILKSQIQQLVEQLASTTEEESVILTASVADGTLCHLGSDSGKVFLEDHEDIKSQFLGFCLKRHHKKKQEQERREAQEREEALARSMQAVTPPRYDGMGGRMGFMPQRSPRYTSPRQHGPHPVAMSRVAPGARMRSPGNRHQPYPMTRPARAPLNFEQQGRSPGQGPGPSPRALGGNKLDGQVIKIEPEDDTEKSNQSASENTHVQTPIETNVSESSQPSSPSVKPSTPSQSQGASASDNEDAKSESSSSTIPNEASDLKLSDTAPTGGLSLDSDLSNIISATSSVTDSNTQQLSTSQDSKSEIEGFDPNVSVKLEAGGDSEMDLEITGVELGQSNVQEPMSSQEWMANVQDVMQGATGSAADMAGQQGYNNAVTLEMLVNVTEEDNKHIFTSFSDGLTVRGFHQSPKKEELGNTTTDKETSLSGKNWISGETSLSETEFDWHRYFSETRGNPETAYSTSNSQRTLSEPVTYSAEEMLEKKGLRGRPSPAQLYFRNLLRDAAVSAGIWKHAPTVAEIEDSDKHAFFKAFDMVPQLFTRKNEIWKRLGESLQNRRKYLLDKGKGKRTSDKHMEFLK